MSVLSFIPRLADRFRYLILVATWVLCSTAICAELPISIAKVETASGTALVASNESLVPVTIRFQINDAMNVVSDKAWPFWTVVPAKSKQQVATLSPLNRAAPSKWSYRYTTSIGDVTAEPSRDYLYRLPFSEGARIVIGQGYEDHKTTHTTPGTRYAVDFSAAERTLVVAARQGLVVDMQMGFQAGGVDPSLIDKANYVHVLHDDGTIGEYAHLELQSSPLRIGQFVSVGQLVGRVGNTGYSSGPHLHFSVNQNTLDGTVSVPLRFANGLPAREFVPVKDGAEILVRYMKEQAGLPIENARPSNHWITPQPAVASTDQVGEDRRREVIRDVLLSVLWGATYMQDALGIKLTSDKLTAQPSVVPAPPALAADFLTRALPALFRIALIMSIVSLLVGLVEAIHDKSWMGGAWRLAAIATGIWSISLLMQHDTSVGFHYGWAVLLLCDYFLMSKEGLVVGALSVLLALYWATSVTRPLMTTEERLGRT